MTQNFGRWKLFRMAAAFSRMILVELDLERRDGEKGIFSTVACGRVCGIVCVMAGRWASRQSLTRLYRDA